MPENTASLLSRPCGSRPRLTAPQAVQAAQAVRSPATTAFGAGQAAPGLRPLRLASHLALCLALRLAALRMTIERLALRRQRHGLRPGGMVAPCAGTPVGDLPAFPGALRAGVVVAPLAPSVGPLRAPPDDPRPPPRPRAPNSLPPHPFLPRQKPPHSPSPFAAAPRPAGLPGPGRRRPARIDRPCRRRLARQADTTGDS